MVCIEANFVLFVINERHFFTVLVLVSTLVKFYLVSDKRVWHLNFRD